MKMEAHQETPKAWINPPHPGRGKSLLLGATCGLLLGPVGVGLYLRSLTELCYALAVASGVALLTGFDPTWVGMAVGGMWAVGRILHDQERPPPGMPDLMPA